jgi:hypothetical protein
MRKMQSSPVLPSSDAFPIPQAFSVQQKLIHSVERHRQIDLQGKRFEHFYRLVAEQHKPFDVQVHHPAQQIAGLQVIYFQTAAHSMALQFSSFAHVDPVRNGAVFDHPSEARPTEQSVLDLRSGQKP